MDNTVAMEDFLGLLLSDLGLGDKSNEEQDDESVTSYNSSSYE